MEQIVVKTECQPNGEIILYYVEDNAADESNGDHVFQLEDNADYEILEASDTDQFNDNDAVVTEILPDSDWSDEELQKLLVFYIDNKEAFLNEASITQHLWAVATKTMLSGKSAQGCEDKLQELRKLYLQQRLDQQNGYNVTWFLYDLSHQAFHDDSHVNLLMKDSEQPSQMLAKIPVTTTNDNSKGVIVVKNVNNSRTVADDKVLIMLKLYLRYKKNGISAKAMWESIAMELGEESSEYWNKRFLNFKQHYLRMLAKRAVDGPASVNWVYMDIFDEIFKDDPVFQNRYVESNQNDTIVNDEPTVINKDWHDTECTILAKYYFDCFDEFLDTSIPNNFLWTEVGRLLDKNPEDCKKKFNELKEAHYEKYFTGSYILRNRIPLEILYDNIISKEVEIEIANAKSVAINIWNTDELDELVKFFYQNLELLKDSVCYFVCWACISRSLKKSLSSCRKQWEELKSLYKSILNDKIENPELQIDWRYIELFDRIFDYGMNTNLLNDYENLQNKMDSKIGVKKVNIDLNNEPYENGTDYEEYDERGFTKRTKRGLGDSKAFKILEYYQKNKDKFSTTLKKKQTLWDALGKQIGMTGEQCAHRFRNLKQVYTGYVQREINIPEMPILWPYYALCKKVFGYRAIKSKLKNNKADKDFEEWTPKEIKQVIGYFGLHFNELSYDDTATKWKELADELQKPMKAVRDKFIELRKSYKRLKTVKEHNPEFKVSWKYYNMFNEIYERADAGAAMEVDDEVYEVSDDRNEDDEDYQCIIVIPEGGDISDLSNAQIVIRENSSDKKQETIEENTATKPVTIKWTKKSKRRLLILYHNYIKTRKGQEIKPKEMWTEISTKLSKTPLSCRKMFAKLKANHLKMKDIDEDSKKQSPYYTVIERILKLKPKFPKVIQKKLNESKPSKDVLLPSNKVEMALQYYLQHIDEFLSPKFEKKYLWTELADFVCEPVNKLFNKINYLKQNYNAVTDEVAGEKTQFSDLLKEILTKENAVRAEIVEAVNQDDNGEESTWSDNEIEQLLVWYLANLDKFKNPKFVRKYLWLEASSFLKKSPLICSKKMTEIRTQYKTMIKESPDDLSQWRFYELCQKIYGTGKKSETTNVNQIIE
ncbi:unnamed protein product [Diatraea saccharalis]|uniref:Myb-like domain-containing protein n=1 Tax=Diatraea saccharalis TaxID=40085 RepID=A0A9P0G172_9NEOP|nr:unnamed protein product [Diatraea saccharalis]